MEWVNLRSGKVFAEIVPTGGYPLNWRTVVPIWTSIYGPLRLDISVETVLMCPPGAAPGIIEFVLHGIFRVYTYYGTMVNRTGPYIVSTNNLSMR